MKKLQKALVLAGLVSMFAAPAAFAGPRFSLVGVGNLSMPSVSSNISTAFPSPSGKFGFGGGALVEFPLGQSVGLEIGATYFQRSNSFDYSSVPTIGSVVTATMPVLEVPVTLDFHLGHVFMISLGGYVSDVIGSVNSTSASGQTQTGTVSDYAQRPMNYGLIGGAGLHIPLGGMTSLRVEGRYHFALQNQLDDATIATLSTASFKQNEVQFYAGLTFGGGMSR